MLKDAGVTKISIGIQSFRTEYSKLLGRDELDYGSMFKALKEVRFETVSMDFIFALPDQTIEILKKIFKLRFITAQITLQFIPLSISLLQTENL